jgi:hypothetical protein
MRSGEIRRTEEGLSQEFNSLDAQRECAEAYILSIGRNQGVEVGHRAVPPDERPWVARRAKRGANHHAAFVYPRAAARNVPGQRVGQPRDDA